MLYFINNNKYQILKLKYNIELIQKHSGSAFLIFTSPEQIK